MPVPRTPGSVAIIRSCHAGRSGSPGHGAGLHVEVATTLPSSSRTPRWTLAGSSSPSPARPTWMACRRAALVGGGRRSRRRSAPRPCGHRGRAEPRGQRRWRLRRGRGSPSTAVVAVARRIRARSVASRSCSSRSSPVNGSSRSSTPGPGARERASATRLASPPLRSVTLRCSKPASPTSSSSRVVRALRSPAATPCIRRPKATLPATS